MPIVYDDDKTAAAAPRAIRYDDDVVKDVKAAVKPAPKKRDEPDWGNFPPLGVAEATANMASGAIAKPMGDLAGLSSIVRGRPDPRGDQRAVREGLTYEPRTNAGKTAMQYNPLALIAKLWGAGAHGAGRIAGEGDPNSSARNAFGSGVEEAVNQIPNLLGAKAGGAKPAAVSADVTALADRGIPLTPGQIRPSLSRAEEGLQSLPFFGDSVKAARGRGVQAMNESAWNDALAPIGEKLPDKVKGNEAAQYVREKLSEKYETLLPKMAGVLDNAAPKNALPGQLGQPPKASFRQELDSLLDLAKQEGGLPPREMRQFRRIVDKEIKEKFGKDGRAPGATLKQIQETLRTEEANFRTGGPYERKLADAIKEADSAMRRMISDVNPAYAKELSAIDSGYARFKVAQQAAASVGAKEGVFTPSQYDRAVRAKDRTKDKRAYSEGNARQQDLSGPSKRVLSDTLPDSGTPFRLSLLHMLSNPKAAALATTLGIPTSLLYSEAGMAMMQRLLMDPSAAGKGAGAAAIGAGSQIPPPPQP